MAEAVADRDGAVLGVLGVDGHRDESLLEDDGDGVIEVDGRAPQRAAEARRGGYAPPQPFAREKGFKGDGIHAGASGPAARTAVGVRVRSPAVLRRAAVTHTGLTS